MAARSTEALSIRGRRILIVEDEYYLADDLAQALTREGVEVLGPCGTLADADRIVADKPVDCAILDMNLRGDMAFPITDRLRSAGIPFLLVTGYGREALPERLQDAPRVEKPFEMKEVLARLPQLMSH